MRADLLAHVFQWAVGLPGSGAGAEGLHVKRCIRRCSIHAVCDGSLARKLSVVDKPVDLLTATIMMNVFGYITLKKT